MDQRNYVLCKIDDQPRSFKDRLNKEKCEADLENQLKKKCEETKKYVQLDHEQQLAAELCEHNRKRICEEKMRQQIRESNESLRQLEQRLRSCYVAKGLKQQMAEREMLQLQEQLDIQRNQLKLAASKSADEAFYESERLAETKKRYKHGMELKNQMFHSQNNKKMLYEDFLKEKLELDEIVKRIHEEHMEELNEKLTQQHKTLEEMYTFQKARKIWKEAQAIEMEEENKRIMAYCDERDRKLANQEDQRKALQENFDLVKSQMVEKLTQEQKEKLKAESVLQDLYAIEEEEKEKQKNLIVLERMLRARIEVRLALEHQRRAQDISKQREEEENRKFYEEQLKLLAEQDKLYQLSDEKRRKKMIQHRKDTEALIKVRQEKRAANVKGAVRSNEEELKEEQRRQQIIEEERHKILKEHAAALIGHLPRDMLNEVKNLN